MSKENVVSVDTKPNALRKIYKLIQNIGRKSKENSIDPWNEKILLSITTDDQNDVYIQKYAPLEDKWVIWRKMENKRYGFGVAIMEDDLIMAGGSFFKHEPLETVRRLNIHTLKLTSLNPMGIERHGVALVVLEDYLFAIGGHDGENVSKSVERWDKKADTWDFVASMHERRYRLGVAVLNGFIYVVGGGTATTECYDPIEDKWLVKASMSKPRTYHVLAILNAYLFAIGGEFTNTIERYDPKTDVWTTLYSFDSCRMAMGCISLNNRLLIVGGLGSKSVEEYDPATNVWIEKSRLAVAGQSICVLANNCISPIMQV